MPQRRVHKLPPIDLGRESIHERIARLRRKRGYSQIELSEMTGISQPLISSYERGTRGISAELAARFAKALGVSTDELIGLKASTKEAAYSLAVARRMQRIEELPRPRRKRMLQIIDEFMQREES